MVALLELIKVIIFTTFGSAAPESNMIMGKDLSAVNHDFTSAGLSLGHLILCN